ncbi:unnamed protein product, partial [Arabidopsis halleri]
MDDLVQTILDRLDNQDARTTERIDALVAAQVASQSQIERIRRRRRTSQPHDNQEELQSPRTPVAERHGHHLQSGRHPPTGPNLPSGHNLLSNQTMDSGRLLPGRHIDDNRSHDQELTRLNALIKDMSSKMHRATTAAPELEKVLEETQRSPFTARLSAVHVPITDDAAIGALRNALLFGSRFREDLIIARPSTLDDALHRANRYIEIEEEKAAMVERQPKASNSKDKAREERYEPRQHYDREYAKNDKGKKNSSFAINGQDPKSNTPWNKYYRDTDSKRSYCEFHKFAGHSTDDCRQLQLLLLSKFKNGSIEVEHDQRKRDDRERNEEPNQIEQARGAAQKLPGPPKRNHEVPQRDDAPVPRRRIHMIMGGLTTCRDSVRSIKNYQRQAEVQRDRIDSSTPTFANTDPITFTEADADNAPADALATLASTSDPDLRRIIPVESIDRPSIDLHSKSTVSTDLSPVPPTAAFGHTIIDATAAAPSIVLLIEEPTLAEPRTPDASDAPANADWIDEIRNYIADGIVPTDKWAARCLRTRSAQYALMDGNLFRWTAAGTLLACVASSETNDIMREVHEGAGGNHSGGRALALRIRKTGHFLPTLNSDCEKFVAKCEKCQRHAPFIHVPTELLRTASQPYPF